MLFPVLKNILLLCATLNTTLLIFFPVVINNINLYLNMYSLLQPKGGILLQCGGYSDGVGRVHVTGQETVPGLLRPSPVHSALQWNPMVL